MARDRGQGEDYSGPLKRLLLGVLLLCLLGIFLVWRIDSPRVERFRAQVVDRVVPSFDWAMAPVTGAVNILRDFQSYQRIRRRNNIQSIEKLSPKKRLPSKNKDKDKRTTELKTDEKNKLESEKYEEKILKAYCINPPLRKRIHHDWC